VKLTTLTPLRIVLAAVLGAGLPFLAASQTTGRTNPSLVISSIDGRDLFVAYCSSCHGLAGKGDGRLAPTLKVPPPDLTTLTERNRGKFPNARVEAVIKGDEPPSATAHRMNEMTIWGAIFKGLDNRDEINQQRIENLVKYLESIQPKAKATPAPEAYVSGSTHQVPNGR
jgi:mono/diheme cytochrome c family protein